MSDFVHVHETETETSLFNTTWHYTDAWYQTYMTVLMYYSELTWCQILACMLGDLCQDHVWSLTQRPPWRDKKIAQQTRSVDIISEYLLWTNGQLFEINVKNREFLMTGWKSLWSLATWLVISDRYVGEVILQLSIEAMASHSNSTKPLPQLRTEYILLITSSSTTHYACFLSDTVYN